MWDPERTWENLTWGLPVFFLYTPNSTLHSTSWRFPRKRPTNLVECTVDPHSLPPWIWSIRINWAREPVQAAFSDTTSLKTNNSTCTFQRILIMGPNFRVVATAKAWRVLWPGVLTTVWSTCRLLLSNFCRSVPSRANKMMKQETIEWY